MRTPLQRLCLLAVASSAYTFLVNGGVLSGNGIADFVAGFGPAYYATLWVSSDARVTRYWPAYHYGLLLLLFWFLAVPHYVLRTRGRGGALLALGLFFAICAPAVCGFVGWCLYDYLPDFR